MAKTMHVTFSNHTDLALSATDGLPGDWVDGFAAPAVIDPLTAVEWATNGTGGGTAGYTLGDTGGTVTVHWRTSGATTYDFELSAGYELLGTITDTAIDLHLSVTAPHVVDGFQPSTHGFAFPNEFPENVALRTLDLGVVKIPIGKASNGLCGGMTFASRDYLEAGIPVPTDTEPPSGDGNPMFEFLVTRLIDTFDLPHLPATLLTVMNPAYPDHDGGLRNKLGADGRARLMARVEFAKVRAMIDDGKPAPICIVKATSTNPASLGENHQVLVYGYQVDGSQATFWIYDPNNPGRDDAGFVFDIGHTDRTIEVAVSIGDLSPIYCYLVTNYTAQTPPT